MNSILFWALIFAVLSPILYAIMNIIDKYAVSHRIKKPLGFSAVAALTNTFFGIILAWFLNWQGYTLANFAIPIIVGILMGISYLMYFLIIKGEDISNFVGLQYTYPILVAILSFIFLNEILPWISYMGMMFVLTGAVIISVRMNKIKIKISLWMVFFAIVILAVNEFLIKVYTNTMPELNGIAISTIFIGLPSLLCLLFNKKIRISFASELKNVKWALLTEFFAVLGLFALFFAMTGLPATVVASIATIQPLFVIWFEKIGQKLFGKMTRDNLIKPKLIGIILIVIGIILLYVPEIMKLIK